MKRPADECKDSVVKRIKRHTSAVVPFTDDPAKLLGGVESSLRDLGVAIVRGAPAALDFNREVANEHWWQHDVVPHLPSDLEETSWNARFKAIPPAIIPKTSGFAGFLHPCKTPYRATIAGEHLALSPNAIDAANVRCVAAHPWMRQLLLGLFGKRRAFVSSDGAKLANGGCLTPPHVDVYPDHERVQAAWLGPRECGEIRLGFVAASHKRQWKRNMPRRGFVGLARTRTAEEWALEDWRYGRAGDLVLWGSGVVHAEINTRHLGTAKLFRQCRRSQQERYFVGSQPVPLELLDTPLWTALAALRLQGVGIDPYHHRAYNRGSAVAELPVHLKTTQYKRPRAHTIIEFTRCQAMVKRDPKVVLEEASPEERACLGLE